MDAVHNYVHLLEILFFHSLIKAKGKGNYWLGPVPCGKALTHSLFLCYEVPTVYLVDVGGGLD